MALPAIVLTGLQHAAMNPKVQSFAGKLAKDVYGKIMPSKAIEVINDPDPSERPTFEDIAEQIEAIATREELVASFAFLQAELDRQNQKTRIYITIAAGANIVVMTIIGYFLISHS